MVDYSKLTALGLRLIKKNGRPVVVRITSAGTLPDSNKPWDPGTRGYTDYSTYGVFYPVEEKFIDGTTVRMTDETFIVAVTPGMPDGISLSPKDVLFDGESAGTGHRCAVVHSTPIAPGAKVVLLMGQIRR